MATLNALITQFDGYSTSIDKINKKTNDVSKIILNAIGSTNKFNSKLNSTEKISNAASGGLGKLFSKVDKLKTIQKGMSIADEYTNTGVRLGLITSNLQEQEELQDKIFVAANRSRGTYGDMASAISNMGITAGEAFGSNDELVAFTELIQKGVKLGGASQTDQSSVMNKLIQGMATGNLQGDDFDSIIEKAPMIADAIGTYTGKSKDELKEMSLEGLITSDIIKNAMFMSCDSINDKFKDMPMTFADVWDVIKNGGLQVFSTVIDKINELTKTDGFTQLINGIIIGFQIMEQIASWCVDAIISNWSMIEPVIWGVIAALLVYNASMGVSWLTTLKDIAVKAAHTLASWAETAAIFALIVAQDGLNAALLACPINWIIISIIALIAIFYAAVAAVNHFAGTSISATGIIVGTFWGLYSFVYNIIATLVNTFISFSDFIGNLFINPVAAIKGLFFDMLITIMEYISSLTTSLKELVNLIPGIEMDTASGFEGLIGDLKAKRDANITDNGLNSSSKWQNDTFGEMFDEGYKAGENFENNFSLDNLLGSLTGVGTENTFNIDDALDSLGTSNNPVTVEGTGSGGKIDVDMGDEDLQYLRDIAERDYINQFSTASLAPNVQFTFGDVHEEADANKVAGRIQKILAEEIAMVAEGVY